jgi:poly(ADP-ribose) glycohydrolase ARH3
MRVYWQYPTKTLFNICSSRFGGREFKKCRGAVLTALRQDQFEGVVIGLAVGDALGAAWEGLDPYLIYKLGPADKIVAHDGGETIFYTDDTQMTIGIVQALLDRGEIEKHALAKHFAANYHPDRAYGQGARQIINAIGAGDDWERVAAEVFQGKGSLGNGAAMRVAPLGLYFAPDLDVVARQAALSASPTHCHEIGVDGARLMAVAAALAAMSNGQPFQRDMFLHELLSVAQTEECQWQIGHAMKLGPLDSLGSFGNSLEAHRSVMTSIMCFANAPDSYCEAVSRAIGQGNDVDTLAAMAGALSGARLGISAIPPRLIESLEDGEQGKTFLLELAGRLYKHHTRR